MYALIRNILFLLPPEEAHRLCMRALKTACSSKWMSEQLSRGFSFSSTSLEKKLFGLHFKNPVGLGAGFDKNATYLRELQALGFGFMEAGTVTPQPQQGNPKPRLFRLPKDRALINRMGFNNDGVAAVRERLENWKNGDGNSMIVGGNIGKNKNTPNEDAWKDYLDCFNGLFHCVDYFVVNVSSPNTPGLRALQDKELLRKILSEIQLVNKGKNTPRPLLLKIAPDLETAQVNELLELAAEVQLDGWVIANTTIGRSGLQTPLPVVQAIGAGGLSGIPLREKSASLVHYIASHQPKPIPIIASGGIFTVADAQEKLRAGAALVQVWTGFIYEGPAIAKNICHGLDNAAVEYVLSRK